MIGSSEIFLIILAIVVLFGPKKLPELARGFGKAMREFQKATDDIKKEISQSEIGQEFEKAKNQIEDSPVIENIKKEIDEIKDNLKAK